MKRPHPILEKSASALVITLSCLVILSIIVAAFLSQAILNRQLAFSSAGQIRAQVLAETAADLIVKDLRAEIEAGSDVTTTGTNTLYFPRTNAAAIPYRNAAASLTNLIRVSRAGSALWSGTPYLTTGPIRSAQQVPTSTASANGRYIKPDRWNRAFLLGTNLPAAFVAPDWFLITRGGVLTGTEPALTNLIDRSANNTNTVIGRFAYVIYDEGGLLDINVAGNALSATNNARRGRLHQADLTRIPGISKPADLIAWRNAVTSTNSVWLDSPTNSFLNVYSGDQRFISRQDLIKYAQQHSDVVTTEALAYLGTFTREKNAPTFRPDSVNPTNNIIPAVIRNDGKPVMSKRFALGNLAMVQNSATANNSSTIYEKFGLTRSSANEPWVYNHGNPARILTLTEIAQQNRDPDFFEVLKSVILEGSLGKTAGDPNVTSADTAYRTANLDVQIDLQVIRIGANLIDQYDTDSWPTPIQFQTKNGDHEVSSGIENLPYINRMFDSPYRPNVGTRPDLYCWWEFEMWNPHQNPSSTILNGPQRFRITATAGKAYASLAVSDSSTTPSTTTNFTQDPSTVFTPGSTWIEFNLQSFGEPTLLGSGNASCDSPPPAPDQALITGLFVGKVDISDAPEPGGSISWSGGASLNPTQDFCSFELQYLSGNNTWVTYQKLANLRVSTRSGATNVFKTLSPNRGFYFRGDPRNTRFGGGANSARPPGETIRGIDGFPYAGHVDGRYTSPGAHVSNPGWTLVRTTPAPTHARLAALANNDSASSTKYVDPDNILRIADGGLRGAAENPLQNGNSAARPIVLNRPFRSVGEMGYAFRDLPWKTLDLFTTNSADAGLLDAFSLDEEEIVAGKVNLNTRQPKVLEALLAGTARQENSLTQTISTADAATMAADLLTFTTNAPLINKADLVRRFSPTTVSGLWPAIKTQREAFSRALTEAGNTRTWNLLIDLVVQVGRYPISAKTYADFTVEGERRYWLHLALDRYTGEIVDEQMEAVSE